MYIVSLQNYFCDIKPASLLFNLRFYTNVVFSIFDSLHELLNLDLSKEIPYRVAQYIQYTKTNNMNKLVRYLVLFIKPCSIS